MNPGRVARAILAIPEPNTELDDEEAAEAAPPSTPPSAGSAGLAGFDLEPERRSTVTWRRVGRGLIFALIGVLVLIGVRTLIAPPAQKLVTRADPRDAFPVGQAQAVATRWTAAYLTLDQGSDGKDARAAALSQDTAAGTDTASGWNGQGSQVVDRLVPGQVHIDARGRRGDVTVLAQVTDEKGKASRWVALSVPVGLDRGGRAVVTGPPAFVALPDPRDVPGKPMQWQEDSRLTTATKPGAAAFGTAARIGDT